MSHVNRDVTKWKNQKDHDPSTSHDIALRGGKSTTTYLKFGR